ncbi:hypothetical protein K1720_02370 [Thermococcus argininiproducens]|uniref:Uncharacterized protein n=1 Tax=Thermococcus argininiproducens TaxID=2866384 RepID=A0A9E7MB08_9EURY|nr:hypothetical protein [Thermococcus argininiproducens]USH00336.1 hypothetical protein K1720_02370 [Thermococcus argininiproducens]
MSKKVVILCIILLLGLSFFVLTFSFVKSETQVTSTIGGASSQNTTLIQGKIYIYIEGNDSLSIALKKALLREFAQKGYEAFEIKELEKKYDGQFLAVRVLENNITYTPIYSKGSLKALMVHSTIGDTAHYFEVKHASQSNLTQVLRTFDSRKYIRGQTMSGGIILIRDTSKGIMTYPGYKDMLVKFMVKALVSEVERINETVLNKS